MVLGALFADGIAPLAVTVAGVGADEAADWLPGGRHRLLLEDQLLPYLLPADQTATLRIEVDGTDGGFTLGETAPGSLLGYTTQLN
jgi:predicted component of type VI protein secretion system